MAEVEKSDESNLTGKATANGSDKEATTTTVKTRKPKQLAKPAPVPGTSSLPAARVAKIIKADKDITKCSKESIFLMSIATVSVI